MSKKPVLDLMGVMKADITPDDDQSCLVFILQTLNKHTMNSIQKMYDVISVLGAKFGMMVQDTILCNCSTHCNFSTMLSRDIDNGPLSNDISPPSSGFT